MRIWISGLVCGLLLATLPLSSATAEEAPSRLVVHHDRVDPADSDEFEAWYKDWVGAFEEAGLGADWNWFTSSSNDFSYVTVSTFGSFADLDQSEARQAKMTEALGKEKLDELIARERLVQSHRSEVVKMRPDLSYQPVGADDSENRFMNIQVDWVRPGMNDRYEELVKKLVKVWSDTKQPNFFTTYQVEFGDGSYVYTSGAKDAVAFYGRPDTGEVLSKALGDEEAQKMYAEWRDCISRTDSSDSRLRPDLSFIAAPAKE